MTALETIKAWISTYPGHDILSQFSVDYTDQIAANGGLFPAGLVETARTEYVTGDTLAENQYNFGLYYVFDKSPGDDEVALINADWIMDFQEWVQQQSILGAVPTFGDRTTAVRAQNGALYSAEDEGTATYMVQLSISFEKYYHKE